MLQFLVWINANLFPVIHLYACMLSEIDCTFRKVGSESQILSVSHQMVISQWHACWQLIDDNLIILRAPFLKNTLQRKCLAVTGGSPLSSGISLCVAETDKENCISLDGGCPSFFVGNMETPHSFVDKQVSLPHSTHKVAFIDRQYFFSAICGGNEQVMPDCRDALSKDECCLSIYIRAHRRKFHMQVWLALYTLALLSPAITKLVCMCAQKKSLRTASAARMGSYWISRNMCFFHIYTVALWLFC
jgi:hypothetical protein